MSATIDSKDSSATQKFFRKLHLNHTKHEPVQQQKPKSKSITDPQKKTKRLSTLLNNRRQEQSAKASERKQYVTEHGITSPPVSPTPNKPRQTRRPSELNRPQSPPKRNTSPAVMSDIVQNQILQEQLEKLATEREKKSETSKIALPSPPTTPAALYTPDSELAEDVVSVRRLRPVSSFAALRPATHTMHRPHHHTHQRPYVNGDYLIVKEPKHPSSRRTVRIHKRYSEHDLYHSEMSELISLDEHQDKDSPGAYQRIKRVVSTQSVSSAPEAKFENLKNTLIKERAVIRTLQKQKEACNRDVAFLSQSLEDLTAENLELKKKLDHEKTVKERFQDDLSSTMDKLNEATEYIRKLEGQNKQLKSEKEKETRELKRQAKPLFDTESPGDKLLAAQYRHSQKQVRLLKSTMEQFLRMGVFNDELSSNLTSPTTSVDLNLFEKKTRQQTRPVANKMTTINDSSQSQETKKTETELIEKKTLEKNLVEKKKLDDSDLDKQLGELLREKEILQAEYSKAPSSGGNALVRRRREELESKLDSIDSQTCRIKLKIRSRQIL